MLRLTPLELSQATVTVARMGALTDDERRMLAIERRTWVYRGQKEQAIRDAFPDITVTRYYQRLVALLDRPEAEEHDPVTVHRLRRITDRRRRRTAWVG